MASMWNLLAGYAGLMSVGQQAFIGLGAYFVVIVASHGSSPFLAIPEATVAAGVVGLPVWWLVSRLRSGYFAITMWVIASVCELIIIQVSTLGGGTGIALQGLNQNPKLLTAYTYWAALAVTVVVLAAAYLLLRGRLGLALTAIRDDETGARSIGARVSSVQRTVFLVAAAGCGAAGAIYAILQQFIVPSAAFSVDFSAEMIFITIIGGIGTIEGPIVGTIVFFVLQQTLSQVRHLVLHRPRTGGHGGSHLGPARPVGTGHPTGSASACSRSATTCGHAASSRPRFRLAPAKRG